MLDSTIHMRRTENSANPTSKTRLARALSKLGFCSRKQAYELIRAGSVAVNGSVVHDPECSVNLTQDQIEVGGKKVGASRKIYLMLNKPRGLITTASDEKGRETVFSCFAK